MQNPTIQDSVRNMMSCSQRGPPLCTQWCTFFVQNQAKRLLYMPIPNSKPNPDSTLGPYPKSGKYKAHILPHKMTKITLNKNIQQ